jgi:hypothetical protein
VLLVAAVVLVAAAFWLWRHTSTEPARVTPREPTATLAANEPTTERARPALPDAPGEHDKSESKRPPLQRDDGPAPSSAPTFKQETLRALKEAAAPALRRCIDDSVARNPDSRAQRDSLSVVFTVKAAAGQVTVHSAQVHVNGDSDDELARCAEAVYNQLHIIVPATQGDGEGVLESSFETQ